MKLYQLILFTLMSLVLIYVQYRYAWANYPRTRRWKTILFSSSFCIGVGIAALLALEYRQLPLGYLLLILVLGGLLFGLLFTFLFPGQMQALRQNRDKYNDSHKEQ